MSEFEGQELKNFKTIIIGKSAVGKSTLLLRYVEGEYNPQKPTIGIDYRFKKVTYQNIAFNLELWDSAGQERYRTIVYNYFNLSKAAVVVFDITNEDSLNDAKMWLQQLILHCGNEIPKILLGNKSDLLDQQKLDQQLELLKPSIEKIKEEFNCEFFAVSAYTGHNVDVAFEYLIKQLYDYNRLAAKSLTQKSEQKQSAFKLNSTIEKDDKKKNKKDCC